MREVLVAGLLSMVAWAEPESATAWQQSTVVDGVTVYRRSIPGSPITSVKGTGMVNATPAKVALVLLDDDRAHEWVDSLAEARVLEVVSPTEYLEYNHASMPLFVSDRDFVTRVTMEHDAHTGTVVMTSNPAVSPLAPERKGIVRGVLSARYVIEPAGASASQLTVEIHADPKGALPAWVVNFFQKDWARETIVGIRMQAAKFDLVAPKPFAAFLARAAATPSPAAPATTTAPLD